MPRTVRLLTLLTLLIPPLGCGSKPGGQASGDPPKAGSDQVRPPADQVAKPRPAGGVPVEPAPRSSEGSGELNRLDHRGLVVFYDGFTQDQMKAYLDHIHQFYVTGKEPKRDYGLFRYQAELAKSGRGMRVVREGDFTRITFPVEERFRKPKDFGAQRNFSALAIPVCHSLIRIDESVRGKVTYATSNDDWSELYIVADKFRE